MSKLPLVSLAVVVCLLAAGPAAAQKEELSEAIDARADAAWQAALKIWQWAEPGYQEEKSSQLLATMLKEAGFEIRPVEGIPTAFVASVGDEKPVIAILGEFDALPGLSQTAEPVRQPRPDDHNYGHACGHHLFGVASASAAIALAEQVKAGKLKATIRFYACPAEEGGAAKVFMVRDGLFDDCDVALHWHPGSSNTAGDSTNLARVAAKFRFYGKSTHAAGAPEQGRSALDAVELTNHAAEMLREHTPDFTRIHYVITSGGSAPNVVPEFAEVYYYVRHPKSQIVRDVYRRLLLCAQAGALATETKLEVEYLGGTMEFLPNNALADVALKNLRALNDLKYTAEETQFATRIQATLEKPAPLEDVERVFDRSGSTSKGSTDVADVSWAVPTTGFTTACFVPGTAGHSWQAVAAGGTTIGRKGMLLASKVLAATAWDVAHDEKLLLAAKTEHRERLAKQKYEPLLEKGQKPPLDYRDPPKAGVRSAE
ncbi:MAG: amidohydrolase [Planctomycetia bacterium]|nr:amidohydrolase [Planctomycetia bacterium]